VLGERGYNGFIADIWSCGVILYVMLAGYLPFEDSTMRGLFEKIEKGQYEFPDYIKGDVRDLISSMLQVNPVKRITIPEIKKHPWFRVGYNEEKPFQKIKVTDDMVKGAVKTEKEVELQDTLDKNNDGWVFQNL
jgi:serine/threonine protein kinase